MLMQNDSHWTYNTGQKAWCLAAFWFHPTLFGQYSIPFNQVLLVLSVTFWFTTFFFGCLTMVFMQISVRIIRICRWKIRGTIKIRIAVRYHCIVKWVFIFHFICKTYCAKNKHDIHIIFCPDTLQHVYWSSFKHYHST